jgi:hypothetical protein
VVLFGADLLSRTRAESFAVRWTQGTASAVVYLLGLEPGRSWTASLDPAHAVPLSVSVAGVGRLPVSGVGAHSLTVTPQ